MKRNLYSVLPEQGGLSAKDVATLVGRRNPVILEIGANIGQTTIEFLREMPDAKIFCFEPDPRAISEFKRNVLAENVHLVECAVGNINGTIKFYQSSGIDEYDNWNQSGSIRTPKDHVKVWPKVNFDNKIEVPIVRLDDWASGQHLKRIDFIWADIQGAEGDLISGGIETINLSRYFYTEYGFRELYEGQFSLPQIDQALASFSVSRIFNMDALFENVNNRKSNKSTNKKFIKIGRNDSCYCGSGRKFKVCHGK